MRIVIDGRFFGLEHAGLGRYTISLIKALSKIDKKNEYILLINSKNDSSLDIPKNWKKIIIPFRHYSLEEQTRLPKILKELDYDFIHFFHFNIPLLFNGKYIVTIHDLLMHKSKGKEATTLNPMFYRLKRIGYHVIFKHAVNSAQKILVPSNFVKNEMLNYYSLAENKVVVTYEGVNDIAGIATKGVLRRYNINNPYFIYTGNAYPHKNLSRAIEATVFLNSSLNKQVDFIIVSSRGVFAQRLGETIKLLGAQKYVRFLGFVPDSDLKSLYSHSVGFVYPSLSEGFGLPGLEAMSAGTIALISDIPVFKEVYKDKAIYFNPYDFSTIEKSMREVLELSDKKRSNLIKEGRKFANSYSWDEMAKKVLQIYDEVGRSK